MWFPVCVRSLPFPPPSQYSEGPKRLPAFCRAGRVGAFLYVCIWQLALSVYSVMLGWRSCSWCGFSRLNTGRTVYFLFCMLRPWLLWTILFLVLGLNFPPRCGWTALLRFCCFPFWMSHYGCRTSFWNLLCYLCILFQYQELLLCIPHLSAHKVIHQSLISGLFFS